MHLPRSNPLKRLYFQRKRRNRLLLSRLIHAGSGTGIRTPIPRTKTLCPAVRRSRIIVLYHYKRVCGIICQCDILLGMAGVRKKEFDEAMRMIARPFEKTATKEDFELLAKNQNEFARKQDLMFEILLNIQDQLVHHKDLPDRVHELERDREVVFQEIASLKRAR